MILGIGLYLNNGVKKLGWKGIRTSNHAGPLQRSNQPSYLGPLVKVDYTYRSI